MTTTTTLSVAGPNIKTKLPGPIAAKLLKDDDRLMSPAYTRSYPLVAKTGHGAIIEDVDGNQFLDFSAGIAVNSTGHCHPEVVAAIQKQAAELIHMSGTDFYYPQMTELADRLSAIAPMKGPHKFSYGNSGAEAVEAALKLARYHTKRQYVIAFYGAFHGRTMGALSVTCSKAQQRRRFSPLVPGVVHVPFPNMYRKPDGVSDDEYIKQTAAYIEDWVFRTEVPEVQAGMGRTGKWWAVQHTGVEPDMITIAKGIASGMPLGILMTRAELMDWVPGSHASTFGGNPVAIAAALATINVLEREAVKNSETIGRYMMDRMKTWPSKLPLVGDVRGLGLMIGVELVHDKVKKTPAGEQRDHVVEIAFEKGVLFLGCGPNAVRLSPPLIITKEQADIAMNVLEESILDVAAGKYVKPSWGERTGA